MEDNLDKVRKSYKLKEEHFELYVKKFLDIVGKPYTEENKEVLTGLIINGVILHELNIKECRMMLEESFEQLLRENVLKKSEEDKEWDYLQNDWKDLELKQLWKTT